MFTDTQIVRSRSCARLWWTRIRTLASSVSWRRRWPGWGNCWPPKASTLERVWALGYFCSLSLGSVFNSLCLICLCLSCSLCSVSNSLCLYICLICLFLLCSQSPTLSHGLICLCLSLSLLCLLIVWYVFVCLSLCSISTSRCLCVCLICYFLCAQSPALSVCLFDLSLSVCLSLLCRPTLSVCLICLCLSLSLSTLTLFWSFHTLSFVVFSVSVSLFHFCLIYQLSCCNLLHLSCHLWPWLVLKKTKNKKQKQHQTKKKKEFSLRHRVKQRSKKMTCLYI